MLTAAIVVIICGPLLFENNIGADGTPITLGAGVQVIEDMIL
jgi:hypothetical protein